MPAWAGLSGRPLSEPGRPVSEYPALQDVEPAEGSEAPRRRPTSLGEAVGTALSKQGPRMRARTTAATGPPGDRCGSHPELQEALLSCAGSRAITRSGTLFDQTSPVIDMRMASQMCCSASTRAKAVRRPCSRRSSCAAAASREPHGGPCFSPPLPGRPGIPKTRSWPPDRVTPPAGITEGVGGFHRSPIAAGTPRRADAYTFPGGAPPLPAAPPASPAAMV